MSGPDLARVWETPAPETLTDDLERFPAELADPFGYRAGGSAFNTGRTTASVQVPGTTSP